VIFQDRLQKKRFCGKSRECAGKPWKTRDLGLLTAKFWDAASLQKKEPSKGSLVNQRFWTSSFLFIQKRCKNLQ